MGESVEWHLVCIKLSITDGYAFIWLLCLPSQQIFDTSKAGSYQPPSVKQVLKEKEAHFGDGDISATLESFYK